MPRVILCLTAVATSLALGGCAVAPPVGPSVIAMPGRDKSLATFQQDDAECQAYAVQASGITPAQAATNSAVGSAVLGTALGAAAGVALGAATGNAGAGAAIGAGTGLLMGSAAGAANASLSGAALQHHYDVRYVQCMAAKGEAVPTTSPQAPAIGYPAVPYATYPYPYPYPAYAYPTPYYYGPPVGGVVVVGGRFHRHW